MLCCARKTNPLCDCSDKLKLATFLSLLNDITDNTIRCWSWHFSKSVFYIDSAKNLKIVLNPFRIKINEFLLCHWGVAGGHMLRVLEFILQIKVLSNQMQAVQWLHLLIYYALQENLDKYEFEKKRWKNKEIAYTQ